MKIREFSVGGFRSLRETAVTGLATKNIFHGDNGSGKSNLLLALETIFRSKESLRGITWKEDGDVDGEPRRSTPFWQGEVVDFGENFYMGGERPISFMVRLHVHPSFLADSDEEEVLASLQEEGHDFRIVLKGAIKRRESAGAISLNEVRINDRLAMRWKVGGTEWLPEHKANTDTKQRVVENILDAFTDQVRVVPASRFLSEEVLSQKDAALRSESYKNWLHSMSLSRDGYETFKRIKEWCVSGPFELGDISFLQESGRLEVMIEDRFGYRMRADQKGSGIQQILVLLGYIARVGEKVHLLDAAVVAVEEPDVELVMKCVQ